MAQIGIKLADGSFYAVMDDAASQRKKVVLSPARDDQEGAQIDILRRENDIDQFVGCLVLENLQSGRSADLELVIGIDGEGNLDAHVGDTGGEHFQSFSVSLDQLESPEHYALPDEADANALDISDAGPPENLEMPDIEMPDLDELDFDDSSEEVYTEDDLVHARPFDEVEDEEDAEDVLAPRPFNIVTLVALILITLSVLALGAYGIIRLLGARMLPELRAAMWLVPIVPRTIAPRMFPRGRV